MTLAFTGQVERGDGLATGLGCPTANLAMREGGIIPGLGVYVGEAKVNDQLYPSVICINDGRDKSKLKLEVHLLDQCLDLQGKTIHVQLFEKLRDLVDWRGEEEMKTLIANDLMEARSWFRNHGELGV